MHGAWRLPPQSRPQMMSSGSELSGAQPTERERHLRVLADKLPFKVEKRGDRFTLSRTIDVSRPVRHERLTLNDGRGVARQLEAARPARWLSKSSFLLG